jgi:arabinogalactan endo-1,4-beta-galactosidase
MIRRAAHMLSALALAVPLCAQAQSFAKGADVSWVSQQEAAGYAFYGDDALRHDPFALLKAKGANAIRLRVWVNPANGWNDGSDTLYKAKRAAAQGQRIMIDFHYSDTWADPAHQAKPAAWSGHSVAQLRTDVYAHTYGILSYLKSNGINVEWVQVGNEINSGMLLPEGSTSNFTQLSGFINSGYDAVKAVYPSAKVVLHLANGHDNGLFRWFFDNAKSAGAKWDVTGMSHYPGASTWSSDNTKIGTNMADMVSRYGRPVIVSEVGMDWQQAATAKLMLADLMTKVKARGSQGLGVFYWEPQAYPGWQGYTLGALNNSGQFTVALDPY